MSHPSYFDKLQRFAGAQPLLGWHIAEDEGGEQETKPTLMFCLGRCENFSSFNNYITPKPKRIHAAVFRDASPMGFICGASFRPGSLAPRFLPFISRRHLQAGAGGTTGRRRAAVMKKLVSSECECSRIAPR